MTPVGAMPSRSEPTARPVTSRTRDNVTRDIRASRDAHATHELRETRAPESRDPDTDAPRTNGAKQFAELLALLAGAGPRVRADVMKQMPAEGASLLDRLLSDSDGVDSDVETASADAMGLGGESSESPSMLTTVAPDSDAAQDAINALRYQHIAGGIDALETSTASPRIDAGADRADSPFATAPTSSTASLLRRIAIDRSATVDQLLARGDDDAAELRASLDAVLAQAGTDAGAQLAQFALYDANGAGPGTPHAAALAAAALAAATARSAADPTTPLRDVDGLTSSMRSRLERVIDRMKSEHGHDVTIVETVRSQERQDLLYTQGRSRPGPVVTWTRNSAHTRGDAVDVIVDGQWDNPDGYAHLQQIAREEGLRTLGDRDPGHLEFARSGNALAKAALADADRILASATRGSSLDLGRGATIESLRIAGDRTRSAVRPADPSQSATRSVPGASGVATVASVAGVAAVAQVATTGGAGGGAYGSLDGDGGSASARNAATDPQDGRATAARDPKHAGAAEASTERTPSRDASRDASRAAACEPSAETSPGVSSDAARAMYSGSSSATEHGGVTRAHSSARSDDAAGATSAQRASDVQQMQDARDAIPGSVSRLVLAVDGENGATDRITVDVRGLSVGAHIDTDRANADRLRANAGELQDALGRHGFEPENVRVVSTARTDSLDAARGLVGERAAIGGAVNTPDSGATLNDARERHPAREWDKQDDARRSRGEEREARQDARGRDARRHHHQEAP